VVLNLATSHLQTVRLFKLIPYTLKGGRTSSCHILIARLIYYCKENHDVLTKMVRSKKISKDNVINSALNHPQGWKHGCE